MKKSYLVMITATVLIIGGLWYCSPMFSASEPVEVEVVSPAKKNIYDSVISRGSIEEGNAREVLVSSARIDKIHAEIGDYVEAGELLFEVTPAENAGFDSAAVSALIPELYDIDLEEIQAFAQQYNIDTRELFQDAADIAPAPATQETKIYSPISGVITDINVKEQAVFSGYKPAAVVSDFNDLYVRLQIPEIYVQRIRNGQYVEISGDALSKKYQGKVYKIHPVAQAKSSLTGSGETVVDTLISITNPDSALKPGYTVNAKVYTQEKQGALTLPYSCIIQDESNRELVYVVKNGAAYKKYIQTGLELENETEITSGLSAEDVVITNPPADMENGARVKGEGIG